MNLFGLLFGTLFVACAFAQQHGDFDEEEEGPHNVAPLATSGSAPPVQLRLPADNAVLSLARAPNWTHTAGPQGPSNWAKYWPKCGQLLQAPINIVRKKVIPSVLKPLKFSTNFDTALHNVAIQNVFRYGRLDFTGCDNRVTIEGGPLPGKVKYYLSSAYYVVGKNKTHGSSTCFDKKRAPFEFAFVFHPTPSVTLDSMDQSKSEVILHFLGKISKQDNPNFAPVIESLKKVKKGGQQVHTTLKSLRSLFPRKTWELNYYTYTGSSVIPPCTEGRIRVIYQRRLQLSLSQYKVLQGLYNEKNQYIWDNYRTEQNNTFVQVFSSVERVPKATTTTMRPKPNVIEVEDPYAPPPVRTTTRSPPNVIEVEDPYAAPPVRTTRRPKPNVITTTTDLYASVE